jgi:hypothetical protein
LAFWPNDSFIMKEDSLGALAQCGTNDIFVFTEFSTLFEKCEVYLSFLLGHFTSPSNVAGYPSFLTVSVTRAFTRHIPHYRTVSFTRRRSLACCTLDSII